MAVPNGSGVELPQGPDAALLAEIETLMLVARNVAQGALAGVHRSRKRGASIEFSEHKVYTPGDDVRHIDWRAYARTDRFHIKQFEDETNLHIELLVDHSGSMAFKSEAQASPDSPVISKLQYAKTLAAALSYLALRQGDATGLFMFASDVTDELPARSSSTHLMEVLTRLARVEPADTTGIVRAIDHFAKRQRRRTVAFVMSDLFDPDPDLMSAFRRLAARRHDVSVLHLLDGAELDFPYDNPSNFESMEDDRRLFVHPRALRTTFVAEMRAFIDRTARAMSEAGIDYRLVDTRHPPARVLGELLRSREARR